MHFTVNRHCFLGTFQMLFLLIILTIYPGNEVNGAKILMMSPSLSKSIMLSTGRISDVLVRAGHEVVRFFNNKGTFWWIPHSAVWVTHIAIDFKPRMNGERIIAGVALKIWSVLVSECSNIRGQYLSFWISIRLQFFDRKRRKKFRETKGFESNLEVICFVFPEICFALISKDSVFYQSGNLKGEIQTDEHDRFLTSDQKTKHWF